MSFVIDKTVTDKAPKKTVVSQFTGNNSSLVGISCTADSVYHVLRIQYIMYCG